MQSMRCAYLKLAERSPDAAQVLRDAREPVGVYQTDGDVRADDDHALFE